MRIDRLNLRNFRCFPDRTFTFDERFTLLIGEKPAGKTAILDGMAVALGAALLDVPDTPSRTIQPQEVRRTDRQPGELVEHYPVRATASGRIGGADLEWTRELRSKKSRTTRTETESIRQATRRLVRRNMKDKDVVFPCIGYYGTDRLWIEQQLRTGRKIDPGKRSSRYLG